MFPFRFRGIAALAVLLLFGAGILACELPGLGGGTKPTAAILSPASGTQVKVGETVAIQSSATDAKGVTRVELWVDGSLVHSDVSSQQQPAFSVTQEWTATVLGSHSVTVKAYNAARRVSDPATITINVIEEGTAAAPTTPTSVTLPPGAPWAAITTGVLNVRRGPGTDYPVAGQLQQNDAVEIVGKNADSSWLQIVYPAGTIGRGWVSVSYAQVRGSLASIPVVEAPPPPTPTPASSP
ncbi:MAG: SH3 domain-containing protein [Anaerolineales bacterium]|nr:MAG: SH3 domain-containing protein [Anaerolineales bacterium]